MEKIESLPDLAGSLIIYLRLFGQIAVELPLFLLNLFKKFQKICHLSVLSLTVGECVMEKIISSFEQVTPLFLRDTGWRDWQGIGNTNKPIVPKALLRVLTHNQSNRGKGHAQAGADNTADNGGLIAL